MKLSDCLDALLPDQSGSNFVLFKHISNRDIAFRIDSPSVSKQYGEYQFAVTWFNVVNPTNVYFIDYDLIKIKTSDLHKWESINVQAGRILRDNF